MDELFKALRHFIVRDLVFVVSGGAVVGAFLYRFDRLPKAEDSWVVLALLAGLGYFVAYALQDGLSITRLVTTADLKEPNAFVKWLYRRFTYRDWVAITVDLQEARDKITDDKILARLERIVTLKQVGTAGAPSLLACAVLFFSRWWARAEPFDVVVALSSGVFAVVLLALAWLKGAQQAEFVARHGK